MVIKARDAVSITLSPEPMTLADAENRLRQIAEIANEQHGEAKGARARHAWQRVLELAGGGK